MQLKSSLYCVVIFLYFNQITVVTPCFHCLDSYRRAKSDAEYDIQNAERRINDKIYELRHSGIITERIREFERYIKNAWKKIEDILNADTKKLEAELMLLPKNFREELLHCKRTLEYQVKLVESSANHDVSRTRDILRQSGNDVRRCGIFNKFCFQGSIPHAIDRIRDAVRQLERNVFNGMSKLIKIQDEAEQCASNVVFEYMHLANDIVAKIRNVVTKPPTTPPTIPTTAPPTDSPTTKPNSTTIFVPPTTTPHTP